MSKRSNDCFSSLISKGFRISAMKFFEFYNVLIVFFITIKFYQNIFITGHYIVGKIIPENYELLFNFSGADKCLSEKCMYEGEVTITMTVSGRADSFFLLSDPETIIDKSKTQLRRIYLNGTKIPVMIINHIHTTGDISTIIEIRARHIFQMLSESHFELKLYFRRQFNDHQGLYNINSNEPNKSILMIAHLVPNRAYRFFPCLSTQYKWASSFEMTFIYPSIYNVVTGNALTENRELSPGTNISIYERTEKIPTEHLFFVIWRYSINFIGPLTFWFPPDDHNDDYSLMVKYTIECLKLISNITNSIEPILPTINIAPVSSSKIIDYYTVPGVTLYKKERALYDDEESSTTDKLGIITIISQAVASHWIGILIHPQSRSDFWIYRTLAHYLADFIIEAVEPQFRCREMSMARTLLWTRSDRDLDASTTIPFFLFDTWDDKMYFRREDYIGYQAMTIIAMIHEIYDFEDVGSLVTQALARWGDDEFGPTEEEMVNSLEIDNVEMLINDWSQMPGIPVIHVTLDRTEQRAELIQERFNPSGPLSNDEFAWTIPIRCFDSSTNEYDFYWMMSNSTLLIKADTIKACLLNTETVVPYRVNYPEAWWFEIIGALRKNPKSYSDMQKVRIIDDMLEFSLAGYIHIHVLFQLLLYLSNEIDYFPWLAGAKAFTKLRGILSTSKKERYKLLYRQFVVKAVYNVYEYLEENIEELTDHYHRLHRKNIVNIACGFGHEKCLRNAEQKLNCYIDIVTSGHCQNGHCHDLWEVCMRDTDEREIILCQGLRRASGKVWVTVLKMLNDTNLFSSVRLTIARGLACTENSEILENYINYVLEHSKLFPSEYIFPILLTAARLSESNAQVILHFIVKNHGRLVERLELPQEYHRYMDALSEDMYYSKADNQGLYLRGSPLTYSELPENVRNILEVNTIRADRLRPIIEDYLKNYHKRSDI